MSWKYNDEYCCDFHRNEAKIKDIESQKLNLISDEERLKFIQYLILDSLEFDKFLEKVQILIDELKRTFK